MSSTQLPPDMVLAYKQYKKDTELVAGWLVEHAIKTGFQTNMEVPAPSKLPKLKGRARKLARESAAYKTSSTPKEPKCKYMVATWDFVPMAEHVAAVQPKIILKRTIQSLWRQTIKTRRDFGEWFESKSLAPVCSVEKHSHFVEVLQHALDILKPCYEAFGGMKMPLQATQKPDDSVLQEVNNIFQHLELEDTTSDQENEYNADKPHESKTATPGQPRAKIIFNEEEIEQEFLFAIWSYLSDVFAVRTYVFSTWQLFSCEKINLIQAASVTNLAIDLVRRGEADFEASLQRPAKYPASKFPTGSLPMLIFTAHLPYQNDGPLEFDPSLPNQIIMCGCEICNYVLYVPYAMAEMYIGILKREPPTFPTPKNKFTVQVPPFPGTCTFMAERYHAKNPSQQASDALREILPNFSMLCLMLRQRFIEDEILHAARHLIQNHCTTIWVSLALQIQVDIERLETMVPIPAFKHFKAAFQGTEARNKHHQKWYQSLGLDLWDKASNDHVGSIVSEFGEWIDGTHCGKSDHIELRKLLDAGLSQPEAIAIASRVPLLENFPLTCGTMLTEMTLEWHILGVRFTNMAGHTILLCHLYNASRLVNPDTPIWPDMELFIRNHTPEKVFVGARPTTLSEARQRLFLLMGMSVTSLAKDSRATRFDKRIAKARQLQISPIAQNLFNRWMGKESRKVDEAAYELQQILYNPKFNHSLEKNFFLNPDYTAFESKVGFKCMPLGTKMVQTLTRLSHGLIAAMPAFIFDHFSMQRRCFEAFGQLNQNFAEMIEEPLAKNSKNKNSPSAFTFSIFNSASHAEDFSRLMTSAEYLHRKYGPTFARALKAQFRQIEDKEVQEAAEDMIEMARKGEAPQLVKKYLDIPDQGAASRPFQPVLDAITTVMVQESGDVEIQRLREVTAGTSYGICLFRQISLTDLYGDVLEDKWRCLKLEDDAVRSRLAFAPENPVFYVLSLMSQRQQKRMWGEGENSHAATGRSGKSMKEYEDAVREAKIASEQAGPIETLEDWDIWTRIFGRQGDAAVNRDRRRD